MAIFLASSLTQAMLDAVEGQISTSPELRIYTGAPPANCAAVATGTQLVGIPLPSDWMAAATASNKTKLGTWIGTVTTTGTAGYFRIWNNAVTVCHMQGTVGTSGADLIVPTVSFVSGKVMTVTLFTLNNNIPN